MATITWESAVQSLIEDPAQATLVKECYFDLPLEAAAKRYYESGEWQAVRDVIGPGNGRRALDIGAGNGIVTYALARDGWAVTAVEPDASNLVGRGAIETLARGIGVKLEVVDGFGETVPCADGAFDLVVCRQVFHHARDIAAFCRELARVLKPGGRFFAFRDHVVDDEAQLQAFLASHPLHRLYGGENAHAEAAYAAAITRAPMTLLARWRHFEAEFNFAPKSRHDVAEEAARRVLPGVLAKPVAKVLALPPLFALLSRALTAIDRRPGRLVAFLAERSAA